MDKIREQIITHCKKIGITTRVNEKGHIFLYCTDLHMFADIYPQQKLEGGIGYKDEKAFYSNSQEACYISEKEMKEYNRELQKILETANKKRFMRGAITSKKNCRFYRAADFCSIAMDNWTYAKVLFKNCEHGEPRLYFEDDISSNEVVITEYNDNSYLLYTKGMKLSKYLEAYRKRKELSDADGDILRKAIEEQYMVTLEPAKNKMSDTQCIQEKPIRTLAYRKYQLDWMSSHGYGIGHIINELEKVQKENGESSIGDIYDEWEAERGFGSELWACYSEFLDSEYQDESYMRQLLTESEYREYLKDIHSLSEKKIQPSAVDTPHGTLKVEPIFDPNYPGIGISVVTPEDVNSMPGVVVEYTPDEKCIRAVCYNDESDEPVSIVKLYRGNTEKSF